MAKKKIEEEKVKETKVSKTKKNQAKESVFNKIANFFHGVKTEAKRIKWPTKKNMVKYSVATIVFIISCSVFFYAIDIILAFLHTLGK